MTALTEGDVRSYLADQAIQQFNALDLGVEFTSEEIASAMKSAARAYNSLPPLVDTVSPSALPGDSNLFLDSIAQHLCILRLLVEQRNDVDYNAGNATASVAGKQIEHLTANAKMYGDRFRDSAVALKREKNNRLCYGGIGG